MRVIVQRDLSWDRFDVSFIQDHGDQFYAAKIDTNGALYWYEIKQGERLTPALRLPHDALKALVDAAEDHVPNDRAQEAHLKDAIKVRDTLLAIVERSV